MVRAAATETSRLFSGAPLAVAADGRTGQRRVVIACQGGGSHTAFTAGVLKRLLGARELAGYQVSGLSGTSGGAVCAAGLVRAAGR